MKIRLAGRADTDVVSPLFNDYRKGFNEPDEVERCNEFIAERFLSDDSLILLAEEKKPVGFLLLYIGFSSVNLESYFTVNDLFVVKEQQGNGIGKALLEHAITLARDNAAFEVRISTQKFNETAQGLYEKAGFKVEEELLYYRLKF